MSTDTGGIASVEHGGFTVSSTSATAEGMKANFTAIDAQKEGKESAEPDLSKAASDLGKKGGEAAAEKRKAEAKEAKREAKAAPKEASEPEEAAEEVKEEKPEKPLGKPRDDPRARMLEATRKEAEAKREAAEAKRERDALRAELEAARRASQPAQEQPKPRPQGVPTPDQFETYEEFLDARDEYRENIRQRQYAQRSQAQEREQRITSYVQNFSKHVSEASKADPEFMGKIAEEVLSLQPSFTMDGSRPPSGENWIADELFDSAEQAPALMLHLTEHPDERQRIAALPTPRAVTREIGKILKGLDVVTAGTDSKPAVSKASPPVRPVTGSPPVADGPGYREGISLDEYAKKWKPAGARR